MKTKALLFAVVTLLGGFALSPTASAAVVDFTGKNVSMTPAPLAIGQTGTISARYKPGFATSSVSGTLQSHSMITFTYTLPSTMRSQLYSDTVRYAYKDGGHKYAGGYTALERQNWSRSFHWGRVDGSPSTPLVFASAQMTSPTSGVVIIKNFSAGLADFSAQLLAFGRGLLNIHYEVSAIPLPAALPMFGLGLLALAGVRKARKMAIKA